MKFIMIFALIISPTLLFAKTRIAATTTDLQALANEVGQQEVDVFAIAKGTQDPHLIEAKPSYMIKLRDVDLVIAQGLDLESAWLDPLIRGSRNNKLSLKNAILEMGPQLDPLEISKGPVSRADGDVHPAGNPHFQLDPIRMGQGALVLAKKLEDIAPDKKDLFQKNAQSFKVRLEEKTKSWQQRLKKLKIKEVITYHKTFSYFCDRFEIKCNLQIEPKPGIPPTTSHLLEVIDHMKKEKIKFVLIENIYEDTVKSKIIQQVPEARVLSLPVSVEGESGLKSTEQLIERIVAALEQGAS